MYTCALETLIYICPGKGLTSGSRSAGVVQKPLAIMSSSSFGVTFVLDSLSLLSAVSIDGV